MMFERKVGEIFIAYGEKIKVVRDGDFIGCLKCVCFTKAGCVGREPYLFGSCHPAFRTDKNGVHFERVE